eukprot:gnl/TRDRNA2_/TRDRNA2_94723_c0_seq1.p1 gnl/TRDRNA2_/TRDRNA2_94723_c0~~gnl/TRDRNA2_/TRDRNA2_94723_c0_seq1.p1  ORF type:complete len:391 (-),score=81.42 gnl/TRDRNA2_/TRDRNA2_94723_c0_seq1:38-1210(-)
MATSTRQLRSTVKRGPGGDGIAELSLATVPIPEPKPNEVVVRMEASPLNPADMSLLLAHADLSTLQQAPGPVLSAKIPAEKMAALESRIGNSMSAGNEGAGVVVKAGSSEQSQALLGKVVGVIGGEMYSEYRVLNKAAAHPFPEGIAPAQAAAWFVNPLAALGMTVTMKREGHKALVLTAAASNCGKILNKICLKDGIPLVNIVNEKMSPGDMKVLKDLGAAHVVDCSSPSFMEELTNALVQTGATIAFDAIGGGELCGQILSCMQLAANKRGAPFSIYGDPGPVQVYVYGGLAPGPIIINRTPPLNMHWKAGGWLLNTLLQQIGSAEAKKLRERVASEITTTFASAYTKEVSLEELLNPDVVRTFMNPTTGGKYLLRQQSGTSASAAKL